MASEGRYDVVFGAKTQQFAAGAQTVTKELNTMGGTVHQISGVLSRYILPVVGAGAIYRSIRGTMDWADGMMELGRRTGLTAEKLQELEYAAKTTGTSMERFILALQFVGRSQALAIAGNATLVKAYKDLGISMDELVASTPEELLMRVGETFKQMGGGAQAMADILKIGGRGIGELLASFSEGLIGIRKRAHEVGAVIDEEVVQRLAAAHDRLEEMELRLRAKAAPLKLAAIGTVELYWMAMKNLFTASFRSREEAAKIIRQRTIDFMNDYGLGAGAPKLRPPPTTGAAALPVSPEQVAKYLELRPQIKAAEAATDLKALNALMEKVVQNTGATVTAIEEIY